MNKSNLAKTCFDIVDVIHEHHVYGAESIINSVVYAAKDEQYLDMPAIIKLVIHAFEMRDKEVES